MPPGLATAYAKAVERSLPVEPGLNTRSSGARRAQLERGPVAWGLIGAAAGFGSAPPWRFWSAADQVEQLVALDVCALPGAGEIQVSPAAARCLLAPVLVVR